VRAIVKANFKIGRVDGMPSFAKYDPSIKMVRLTKENFAALADRIGWRLDGWRCSVIYDVITAYMEELILEVTGTRGSVSEIDMQALLDLVRTEATLGIEEPPCGYVVTHDNCTIPVSTQEGVI